MDRCILLSSDDSNKLIGLRILVVSDLCLGDLDGSFVLASEGCALNTVGAEFIEISPGNGCHRWRLKSTSLTNNNNGPLRI